MFAIDAWGGASKKLITKVQKYKIELQKKCIGPQG